jgi:hypothetical protein
LSRTTNYNGDGSNTASLADVSQIAGPTAASYAWDETGTVTQIASSSTIVNNEALILKFAATPAITTPTGAYTAKSDFICVATY